MLPVGHNVVDTDAKLDRENESHIIKSWEP